MGVTSRVDSLTNDDSDNMRGGSTRMASHVSSIELEDIFTFMPNFIKKSAIHSSVRLLVRKQIL